MFKPKKIGDGKILVPFAGEGPDGELGDGLIELEEGSKEYEEWLPYIEDDPEPDKEESKDEEKPEEEPKDDEEPEEEEKKSHWRAATKSWMDDFLKRL